MHIFPRICFIRKIPTTPTHKFMHYQTSNNKHTVDGFRNPQNNHLGWKKKLVQNNGRNNMDKLPTSTTGEFTLIFWTINTCRPTCTWQLKGSVTVGKDRCGALTNTGTCIHEVLGGGHRGHPSLRSGYIWYDCKCRWKNFLLKKYVFSGCYHLFLGWRTTYKPMHVACYLSEFQKLFSQVGPSCLRGVLSWQSLVSFYLAME